MKTVEVSYDFGSIFWPSLIGTSLGIVLGVAAVYCVVRIFWD